MSLKIGVNGAGGRMGRRVVALTMQDAELSLSAALEHSACPFIGQDAGELAGAGRANVVITSSLQHPVDAIIDFSTPEGLHSVLDLCASRRIPLVVATTGITAEQRQAVHEA
ncbi:MAG: 4-hydroxy-tetrahydrodipicolinate reductase, partial [Planctomycetaceae bacterium]